MNHAEAWPCFIASQALSSRHLAFLFRPHPPPAQHLTLPLSSSFQTVLETQRFVYSIRADDLKRPLTVARSQRPLGINLPFFGLSVSGTLNIYTLGASPKNEPQQIIHSRKQPSLVEREGH